MSSIKCPRQGHKSFIIQTNESAFGMNGGFENQTGVQVACDNTRYSGDESSAFGEPEEESCQKEPSTVNCTPEPASTDDSRSYSPSSRVSYPTCSSFTSRSESPSQSSMRASELDEFDKSQMYSASALSESNYLSYLYPVPVHPPSYHELPPGGCPRYPILDDECANEQLPRYTAAAFKIGICQRKSEWVSPHDMSFNRSWKTVLIELNSTQLNFYSISTKLEKQLQNKIDCATSNPFSFTNETDNGDSISSIVTSSCDVELYKIWKTNGEFNKESFASLPVKTAQARVMQEPSKKSSSGLMKTLIRSYSLQHSRFGLASDYFKKPNVLRLRLENEQILIHFSSAQELIGWNLALSIGKGVSLDLSEREMPKYRTVPRRRRNTERLNLSQLPNGIPSSPRRPLKSLNQSSNSGFRGNFETFLIKCAPKQKKSSAKDTRFNSHVVAAIDATPGIKTSTNTHRSTISNLCFQSSADGHSNSDSRSLPNGDDDVDRTSGFSTFSNDNQQSDEEYDEVAEEHSDTDYTDLEFSQDASVSASSSPQSTGADECKWEPAHKAESKRRFIRNSLKCIRPLGFDDKWLNMTIVKPIALPPLFSHFTNHDSSSSVYLDRRTGSMNEYFCSSSSRDGKSVDRSRPEGSKARAQLSLILTRTPHHNLQEYTVGTHGLIPRSLC